jgi:hypothetical protein
MNTIEHFEKVTGYSIRKFFIDYGSFVENDYNSIVDYFSGRGVVDKSSLRLLDQLIAESQKIEGIFISHQDSLSSTVSGWELYEDFSNVTIKLQTIYNTPRWVRSSYFGSYDKDTNIELILKQSQSIEGLTEELGYPVPDDDWVEIAIKNNLHELDYSKEGGNLLSVSFNVNSRFNSNSVVDIMVGDNILGKDLFRELVIEDGDILSLNPGETVKQSAEILINITKGSVPEFPKQGVENVAGMNINMVRYPSIFRELVNLFRQDDTFKEVEVIGVDKVDDNIQMSLRIKSKLNDVLEQNIYLNV